MDKKLLEKVQSGIGNASDGILLIKAKGGFKFRKQIPLKDEDIERKVPNIELTLTDYVVRAIVAEHLLAEKPPHFLCRWDEYQERLAEVVHQANELAEADARRSRLRSFSGFLASGR